MPAAHGKTPLCILICAVCYPGMYGDYSLILLDVCGRKKSSIRVVEDMVRHILS